MNLILIGMMATVIVSLVALSLWLAKREDDELADLKRRLRELEKNEEEDE